MIWVVLLTLTFALAILTTPKLLTTNSQNDSTNNSKNTTDSFPEEFTGYCMSGGYCFYLEEQKTVACECPDLHGGKGVKNFYGTPGNANGNVYMKCANGNLKRLVQRFFQQKFMRDE